MKILQSLCMTMLTLSASAGNAVTIGADTPGNPHTLHAEVVSDDSFGFNNTADNPGWETPDLPYARLLAQSATLNAPPRWRSAGARYSVLPPSAAATPPAVQQANVPPPVPEASMVSMLLVGLGLLAFSIHGEKQEKFDG